MRDQLHPGRRDHLPSDGLSGRRLSTLRSELGLGHRRPRGLSDPMVRRAIDTLAAMAFNPQVPEEALAPFFDVAPVRGQPVSASIALGEELRQGVPAGDTTLAESLMGSANEFARWRRRRIFRSRHESGDRSPILIAEGDSWFHFPIFLRDVVIQLSRDHLVWPIGAAGDTLSNMVWGGVVETPRYAQALVEWGDRARAFLFSGGGNDLAGPDLDGFYTITRYVRRHEPGRPAAWHIDTPEFARRLVAYEAAYRHLVADIGARFPNLPVIIHGYDYPWPYPFGRRDRRSPRWIARDGYFGSIFPMLGITDHALQCAILHEVINALNAVQRRLAGGNVPSGAFPNVFHVDLRYCLGAHDWADEMHPTNGGYARIADRFRTVLRWAGVY